MVGSEQSRNHNCNSGCEKLKKGFIDVVTWDVVVVEVVDDWKKEGWRRIILKLNSNFTANVGLCLKVCCLHSCFVAMVGCLRRCDSAQVFLWESWLDYGWFYGECVYGTTEVWSVDEVLVCHAPTFALPFSFFIEPWTWDSSSFIKMHHAFILAPSHKHHKFKSCE